MESFEKYCTFREMAQSNDMSNGQVVKVHIPLDDDDDAFIAAATKAGVNPGAALRARYTTLLKDVKNDGPVNMPFPAQGGKKIVNMQNTGYSKLVQKLQALGLNDSAQNGFSEISRTDAVLWLKPKANGKRYLSLNEKKSKNPDLNKMGHNFGDELIKSKGSEVANSGFEDVYQHIEKTYVGKTIRPEVWEAFKKNLEENNYEKKVILPAMSHVFRNKVPELMSDKTQLKTVMVEVLSRALVRSQDPTYNEPETLAIDKPQLFNSLIQFESRYSLRHRFGIEGKKGEYSGSASSDMGAVSTYTPDQEASDKEDIEAGIEPEKETPKLPTRTVTKQAARRRNTPGEIPAPAQSEPSPDNRIEMLLRKMTQGGGAITPEEDTLRKQLLSLGIRSGLPRDQIDALNAPVTIIQPKKPIVDDEWDYEKWLRQQDEVAGATSVVGKPDFGPDWQPEGDPTGEVAKRNNLTVTTEKDKMKKPSFKDYAKKREKYQGWLS